MRLFLCSLMPSPLFRVVVLLCVGLAGPAAADPPDWTIDPAGWSDFMAVTGRLDIGSEPALMPGTLVGAFVEGELRGVAEVDLRFVTTLGPLFFLQVWSNGGPGDLVTFRAYDPVTDAVLPIGGALPFDATTAVGTPEAPFVWSTQGGGTPPPWDIDPGDFEFFMSVTGSVLLSGDPIAPISGHLVAAFVGDELRGVAEVNLSAVDPFGPLFFLQIRSNVAEGETVRFEFWDAAADVVFDLEETVSFEHQSTVGTVPTPFVWNAAGGPFAFDDTATTYQDEVLTIPVLANDPGGDALTVTTVSAPAHGTAEVSGDGTVTYTPAPGFLGADSFTYTAADGQGGEAMATVTITVLAVNAPPSTLNDEAETNEDAAVFIDVLANDTDPDGDALTVTEVSTPSNGTAEVSGDGGVTYTPVADFFGVDAFTYTAEDGNGSTGEGLVTVTVLPVNDAPLFESEPATSGTVGALYTYAIVTDDVDGDPVSISASEIPAWLTLTEGGDGTATLSGSPPAAGAFAVTLVASDGDLSAEQVFTLTVTASNAPPDVLDDEAETDEDTGALLDVLENDTDPEGDVLSIVAVQEITTEGGSAEPDGTNSAVLYTPPTDFAGTDTFTYTVSDGNGGEATATVTVTVSAVNDAPVFVSEPVTSVEVGISYLYAVVTSDVDDETLEISALNLPAWLMLTDAGDGTASLAGSPPGEGTYAVTLAVNDGELGTEQAFTVTVTGTNGAPTAADDAAETDEDVAVTIDVLENDSDPDGDALTVTAVSAPSNGVATSGAEGGVTYTPAPDFFGTDAFNYTASDGNGGTATATVTVTVAPVNDAPTPAVITAPEDGMSIVLTGNPETPIVVVWGPSTDVEGDALTYRWEAALEGDFSTVLLVVETEETSVSTTFGVLDEALAAAGVGTGETVVVMHRVVTSDGEAETLGPQAAINVTRGVLTDSEGTVPFAFSASAAYPNPSAGRTSITLDLPIATDVVVEVYDSAGRRVLARSEAYSAGASRRVELGSSRLSAGVYHYRVRAGAHASAEGEATTIRGRFAVVH